MSSVWDRIAEASNKAKQAVQVTKALIEGVNRAAVMAGNPQDTSHLALLLAAREHEELILAALADIDARVRAVEQFNKREDGDPA